MKKLFTIIATLGIFHHIAAQNIGVGIPNPTRAKFELNGAAGLTSAIFGGESTGISLQRNMPGIGFNQYFSSIGKYISPGYAATQYLNTNNGNMYIDMFSAGDMDGNTSIPIRALSIGSNGSVGVGGDTTSATLSVARNSGLNGTAVFMGTQNNSHFNYAINEDTYIRAGKSGRNVFINDIIGGNVLMGQQGGSTKVGVNAINPTHSLEIVQSAGTGLLLINPLVGNHNWELVAGAYSDTSASLDLKYDGFFKGWFQPNGAYVQISDKLLKKNVESIVTVLDKILHLNPVSYEMKYHNQGNKRNYGFIAQEVEKIFPEMVEVRNIPGNELGGPTELHAVNYAGFSVLAIEAIKEQQKIIDQLTARLEKVEQLLLSK